MTNALPLHAEHQAAGAVFAVRTAWVLPDHYGDPAAEEDALNDGVGVVDRSDLDLVDLTGPDRATFLQGLCTNDVLRLEPGRGCLAAHLNVKARVQTLMTVLALPDRLRLIVPPGAAPAVVAKLDAFRVMEDLELEDVSRQQVCLSLQGPRTAEVAARLTGLEPAELAALAAPPESLSHCTAEVAGAALRLVGVDESGRGGLHLWAPAAAAPALWRALWEAGRPLGLRAVGRQAAEAARIRAGRFAFGSDVDEETFFPELPLDRLVSWTKGCYLGQEPVARTHYRGHANRGLAGLLLDPDAALPPHGTPLLDGEREVGHVTSAAYSWRLAGGVALALIRRELLEPGSPVTLRDPAGAESVARVAPFPIDRAPRAQEPS